MSDLINRADAIEAIQNAYCKPCKERGDDHNEVRCRACAFDDAIIQIDALPSAETHEIRTETRGVCLISKDDAMGAVQDHFNANGFKGYDDGQKMMDRINALPSADAEWIPVSERLPEIDGWYLVTVQGYETVTDVAPFNDELWKGLAGHQEVIAWMPLPKPYREDGE